MRINTLMTLASVACGIFLGQSNARAQAGRQQLGIDILNNGRITLYTGFGTANSNSRQNIIHTSQCQPAFTDAGARPWLHTGMLQAMKTLATTYGYSFRITSIAGATHTAGSLHYSGTAFDVDLINGVRVAPGAAHWQTFIARARAMGATQTLGPGDAGHSDHIHMGWPTGTAASSPGGCNPPTLTLNGAVSYNQDGRMQVFAVAANGNLYTSGQTANNQSTWSTWLNMGGNWPGRTAAVATNLDGRIQVFLVGTDGSLYTCSQTGPNQGAWTGWQSMGGTWTGKDAVVGYNQDGRMQVFLIGTDYGGSGKLYTSGQTFNNQSTWSSWLSVGGNWPNDRVPAVGRNLDGRLQVFLVGTDYGSQGYLWTSAQTGPNQGAWTAWQSMGGNWPNKRAVVGNNQDGRMQVFLVGTDFGGSGYLYTSGQTANNQSSWSSWLSVGGNWPTGRIPAVSRNLDGRIQIFLVGTDYGSTGYIWTSAQTGPNQGAWTGWSNMGGNWPVNPFVGKNADGRMQVFCIGNGHEMDTSGQTANNQNTWSGWLNMGGYWPAF